MTEALAHARVDSSLPVRFEGRAVARPVPDAFEGRDILCASEAAARVPDEGIGLAHRPSEIPQRLRGQHGRRWRPSSLRRPADHTAPAVAPGKSKIPPTA
jgi:hypothetical protein